MIGKWKNECDRWDVQRREKMGQPSKSICVCCWKLCAFFKFWISQQYECKECNWKTITNSKGKRSVEYWTQTKVGGGSGIVEKNKIRKGVKKSREKNVEYSAIGYKVVATFIIIFRMCRKEDL